MPVIGLLRVKNEARWIHDVIASILPVCERIFVFDDHSTDGTPEICNKFDRKVETITSPFDGLDESRDKNFLLRQAISCVPDECLRGDGRSSYWALAIDGDEILDPDAAPLVQHAVRVDGVYGHFSPLVQHAVNAVAGLHSFRFPIRYLWNNDLSEPLDPGHRLVRVDGVYGHFSRPSLFRLYNRAFSYQTTQHGGNLHCSSIPKELLRFPSGLINAPLWHLGYNDKADRMRKFQWYNRVDPDNLSEDRYQHCIQGDGYIPASAKLKHAGPLRIEKL